METNVDLDLSDDTFNPDEWYQMQDLADAYNVRVSVVNAWVNGDVLLSDYEHYMVGGNLFIHDRSWEQFCEDFWFRNVPR